jgi:hypothetical protein
MRAAPPGGRSRWDRRFMEDFHLKGDPSPRPDVGPARGDLPGGDPSTGSTGRGRRGGRGPARDGPRVNPPGSTPESGPLLPPAPTTARPTALGRGFPPGPSPAIRALGVRGASTPRAGPTPGCRTLPPTPGAVWGRVGSPVPGSPTTSGSPPTRATAPPPPPTTPTPPPPLLARFAAPKGDIPGRQAAWVRRAALSRRPCRRSRAPGGSPLAGPCPGTGDPPGLSAEPLDQPPNSDASPSTSGYTYSLLSPAPPSTPNSGRDGSVEGAVVVVEEGASAGRAGRRPAAAAATATGEVGGWMGGRSRGRLGLTTPTLPGPGDRPGVEEENGEEARDTEDHWAAPGPWGSVSRTPNMFRSEEGRLEGDTWGARAN